MNTTTKTDNDNVNPEQNVADALPSTFSRARAPISTRMKRCDSL
jgi:hypothetical protein